MHLSGVPLTRSTTMQLKTASERAAEIRAESEARERKAAEKKVAAHQADAAEAPEVEEQVDYAALAKAEEARAVALKADVDKLQQELDPTLRPKRTPTEDIPNITELLSRHDNAEDTLKVLHDAILKMREQAGANIQKTQEWPSDLSHLTEKQRAKTLAEMEAGKNPEENAQCA